MAEHPADLVDLGALALDSIEQMRYYASGARMTVCRWKHWHPPAMVAQPVDALSSFLKALNPGERGLGWRVPRMDL